MKKQPRTEEEIKQIVDDRVEKFKLQNPDATPEEIEQIRDFFMGLEGNNPKKSIQRFVWDISVKIVFLSIVYLAFLGLVLNNITVEEKYYVFVFAIGLAVIQAFFRVTIDYVATRFGHPLFWYLVVLIGIFLGLVFMNNYFTYLVFATTWWLGLFYFGSEVFNIVWQLVVMRRRILK